MLWTVLYLVNPTTVTVALLLSFTVALILARARPPIRALTLLSGALYIVVLIAPLSAHLPPGEGGRSVIWDPTLSFQDIGDAPDPLASFGVTLEDGSTVHYSHEELTPRERDTWGTPGTEALFVHGEPGELTVTDVNGDRMESPPTVALVEEELEQQADHAERLEQEGLWGHSGGLALQERVLNTLLFVPIGIAAFFAFDSWAARLLFGPALSLLIETGQWALATGRLADTGDLLVNGAGSLLGTLFALVAVGVVSLLPPRRPSPSHPEPA
ncbi:VanZ family protein [Nocardiopsis alba]|uniref:VanZ family protein n=1 Tax=Nocardiopsis alba TaxID=53437 RepID=UPI00366C74F2